MIDTIIDGDFFRNICDISWTENIPDKNHIIIYANTHDYVAAIQKIENNPDKMFTLVTHNSDCNIEQINIPNNLVKWYSQNVNFIHSKVSPIPIGLENQHWHPIKRSTMDYCLQKKNNTQRKIKALCQFNPVTYREERQMLLNMVLNERVYADQFYSLNGVGFESYADNLTKYRFCLCPRGNGIDTHRIWECILLGCIPIVKKHVTHIYDEKLPIIFINSWDEVTESFISQKSKEIDDNLFNNKILTKEYWKKKICNT